MANDRGRRWDARDQDNRSRLKLTTWLVDCPTLIEAFRSVAARVHGVFLPDRHLAKAISVYSRPLLARAGWHVGRAFSACWKPSREIITFTLRIDA